MSNNEEVTQAKSFVITGADNIEMVRLIAIRSALKLETKGLKKHGRSARVLANEAMGTKIRTAVDTYEAYNTYLVERGAVDRPLNPTPKQEDK